jgi:hypothetical protein
MKQVVIEMVKGVPVVKSCPRKIKVIIRHPKKRGLKKQLRTVLYHIKTFVGIQ